MCAVRILQQPMPLARSILWAPRGASRPGDHGVPVFLQQSALQAMYEHLAAPPPPGQGVLGFLLGDRCECPVSGTSYSVIDAALRLNQTIYGDRSLDVVTRLWKRLQSQLEGQQAHLIGWYHTHPPAQLELSVHDVETHEQYFGEPWQVGVLVGTDPAAPEGAFFRLGGDDAWVRTPQQFYELLNEDSVRAGGKKRSFMAWKNYRAYNPPALQPRSSPRPPSPPSPPPESSGMILGLEQTALVTPPTPPRAPHRPVEEPAEPVAAEEPEPTGMENMPQAELEEPGRVDLDAPAAPPSHTAEQEQEEESDQPDEWEDAGALKFLSAADDSPPPVPAPAGAPSPFLPPPLPLSFGQPDAPPPEPAPAAASDEVDPAWPEDRALEEAVVEEQALEPAESPPPERPAKARRASRGILRKVLRSIAVLAGVLVVVAGGVAAWPYVPGLLQRLKSFVPARQTRASDTPPPRPVAPSRAEPPPVAPRPPIAPRAEFALLDQAADSLGRALQAYGARGRLFDKRRLDCLSLGRGAVRVERAAASYGFQRNATRATLDAQRGARDLELRAGLDSASRQFLRSACEHP